MSQDPSLESIGGHTQIVGLVGWPVEHSVSPAMHNAAFAALGLNWRYVALPVEPDRVSEALQGVRALGMRGVNITVPHKQAALKCMDELTPAAQAIGATNTLILRNGRMIGHNTDAGGFLRALRQDGFDPDGCKALMLGAGGAARAVAYALAEAGCHLTILNRTVQRARDLATTMGQVSASASVHGDTLSLDTLRELAPTADLVINATSLGMWPNVDGSPWPRELAFPSGAFYFDLVYNPRLTRLGQQARDAGARVGDGLAMLVHQGVEAFVEWTGVEPPADIMMAACEQALGGN